MNRPFVASINNNQRVNAFADVVEWATFNLADNYILMG